MKNVYEVLRQKELEVSRVEKEVEALRVAAPLLSENDEAAYAASATSDSSSTQSQGSQSDQFVQKERTRRLP
jgi:hypothetical protein